MKPEEFLKKIKNNPELSAQFAVLLADNGAIKRDAWQEGFGTLSHSLALGTFTAQHTIVSKDGNGDYTTIGEAVQNARLGSEIYIRPGVYNEKVVLDKSIELVGDGPAGSVTILNNTGGCLLVTDAKVKIRGLFLRGAEGGISTSNSHIEIVDCNISSPPHPAVDLHSGSHADIQHTVIHHSLRGISMNGESSAIVTDCEISDSSEQGVAIQASGGHVLVQRCRVHDNRREGIWVDRQGRATLSECDISASHDKACVAASQGDLTIQNCKIHSSFLQGVYVEESHMTMDHSEVYDNTWEGVASFRNSVVTVMTSKIKGNHYSGFRVYLSSLGINDCDITQNVESGVDMKQGRVTIDNSRITDNGLQGVLVEDRSTASVSNSTLYNNRKGPVSTAPGSRFVSTSNRL